MSKNPNTICLLLCGPVTMVADGRDVKIGILMHIQEHIVRNGNSLGFNYFIKMKIENLSRVTS